MPQKIQAKMFSFHLIIVFISFYICSFINIVNLSLKHLNKYLCCYIFHIHIKHFRKINFEIYPQISPFSTWSLNENKTLALKNVKLFCSCLKYLSGDHILYLIWLLLNIFFFLLNALFCFFFIYVCFGYHILLRYWLKSVGI